MNEEHRMGSGIRSGEISPDATLGPYNTMLLQKTMDPKWGIVKLYLNIILRH